MYNIPDISIQTDRTISDLFRRKSFAIIDTGIDGIILLISSNIQNMYILIHNNCYAFYLAWFI